MATWGEVWKAYKSSWPPASHLANALVLVSAAGTWRGMAGNQVGVGSTFTLTLPATD